MPTPKKPAKRLKQTRSAAASRTARTGRTAPKKRTTASKKRTVAKTRKAPGTRRPKPKEEEGFPWGLLTFGGAVVGVGLAAYKIGQTDGAAPYVDDHTPATTYEEVLVRLRKKVTKGCVDPPVRKLGCDLAEAVRAKRGSRLDELFDLYFWVRDHIRGHDDPVGRPDYFAPAADTLQSLCGDCDDYAILTASLLQANGFHTKFLVVPRHVVALAVLTDDLLRELVNRFPHAQQLVRSNAKTKQKLLPLEVVDRRLGPGQIMKFTETALAAGSCWFED